MLVKCIKNKIGNLPNDIAVPKKVLSESYLGDNPDLNLTVGKQYVVYAVEFQNEPYPKFYICNDLCVGSTWDYPLGYFSVFFEIVDSRLSKYWHFGLDTFEDHEKIGIKNFSIFAFKEWVDDMYFYDKLSDGKLKECQVFEKYKRLMDNEFS